MAYSDALLFWARHDGPVAEDAALVELQESAVYWSVGERSGQDVVDAACAAVVAGHDSPALLELAGVSKADVDWEVPDLLPPAMHELGLKFYGRGSREGQLAAVKLMARYCLAGTMPPRALAAWAHHTFTHGESPDIEQFLSFDDRYDIIEYTGTSEAALDAEVLAACRELITE